MSTVSKQALRFQNRILSFYQDVEFMDLLQKGQKANKLLPDETLLFAGMTNERHPHLSKRGATKKSREIVVLHLRKTVYSAYIKDLYEELTMYLKDVLFEAAKIAKESQKAKRLLGDQKITLSASDILQFSSLDDLTMQIAENIIQGLERERSTKELIEKICKKIDLTVEKNIIEQALPYLELRHKLVHADGKVDSAFQVQYPMLKYNGSEIILNDSLICKATSKVSNLVLAIDEAARNKGILTSQ